jgi:hypothetical protein
LTGSNTNVESIAAGPGTALYLLAANNGGPNQVWQYNGTTYDWTALTGTNTDAAWINVADNRLFMLAANDGGPSHIWEYDGIPGLWTVV